MYKINTPSLIYVCLSRVRRLSDLCFTREFDLDLVQPSRHTEEWLSEQERLLKMETDEDD